MIKSSIPVRSTLAPQFQASRWQKIFMLVDVNEMKNLLGTLKNFWIVPIGQLVNCDVEYFQHQEFLDFYTQYIASLKKGEEPISIRGSFAFTIYLEACYRLLINEKSLIKIHRPVVQLQPHRFDYSHGDGKFRTMVLGYHSIHWGFQFSYPYFYQDENFQVFDVKREEQFPNTLLFKILQKWVRKNTIATPFIVGGKQINVPIRLGKECLSWINNHPQFQAKGLRVLTRDCNLIGG